MNILFLPRLSVFVYPWVFFFFFLSLFLLNVHLDSSVIS